MAQIVDRNEKLDAEGATVCKWGTDELCLVPMPPELSHTDEFRWAIKGVDACIAPIVNALNAAGIYTANCCCGHNRAPGWISLHDGRTIWITKERDTTLSFPNPADVDSDQLMQWRNTRRPATLLAAFAAWADSLPTEGNT